MVKGEESVREVVVLVIAVVRVVAAVMSVSLRAEGMVEASVVWLEWGDEDLASGSGVDGVDMGARRGVVVVGAELMCWRIRSGTVAGVTLSMNVKAGRRRTVVGADADG